MFSRVSHSAQSSWPMPPPCCLCIPLSPGAHAPYLLVVSSSTQPRAPSTAPTRRTPPLLRPPQRRRGRLASGPRRRRSSSVMLAKTQEAVVIHGTRQCVGVAASSATVRLTPQRADGSDRSVGLTMEMYRDYIQFVMLASSDLRRMQRDCEWWIFVDHAQPPGLHFMQSSCCGAALSKATANSVHHIGDRRRRHCRAWPDHWGYDEPLPPGRPAATEAHQLQTLLLVVSDVLIGMHRAAAVGMLRATSPTTSSVSSPPRLRAAVDH